MPQTEKKQAKKLLIRKGDQVVVISGKDKDRKTPRTVIATLPREGKVIVEGVNVVKDAQKPRATMGPGSEGSIVEKPMPIDASNVQLVDPKSGKATRVRLVKDSEGKRQRVSIKSGETISA